MVLMDKIGLSKHCSLEAEYGYKRSICPHMYIDYSFFGIARLLEWEGSIGKRISRVW